MSLTNLLDNREEKRNYGVVIGVVTNNNDPQKMGRVKIKFPWRESSDESNWTRIATAMAGKDRGTYFLPEVGDEVLVSFEHGDIQHPYVIGALWNGQDKPPETNKNGKNDIRTIKSRCGHKIIFNDEQGKESLEIETKSGQKIVLDDSAGKEKVEITDKNGNKILIESAQNAMNISSKMKISIQAPMIEIKADSMLTLQGGLAKIN
jgi:uncharacterized protein involved in type VI secretion and phage assembly